jgi:glycosyltransferase involved in cell wall biosynthesis
MSELKVLFWISGKDDPSPRFRFVQYIESFRAHGVHIDTVTSFPSRNYKRKITKKPFHVLEVGFVLMLRLLQVYWVALFRAKKYDVIYTNKDILPNLNITIAERILSKFNKNLVFDMDDAIYLGKRGRKLDEVWKYYKAIIGGSTVHIDYIHSKYHIPSYYVPMGIDTAKYLPIKERKEGVIRIGWSGSHHTNVYALPFLKHIMEELAEKIDYELIIISNVDPKIEWKNVKSRFILWTPETEVAGLQQIDIGLMPLQDEPFERGKCALKAVQYMAIGIPALVSPVGVNETIVTDGFNGYHCRNDQEFISRMIELSSDVNTRTKLGENARKTVVEKYSIEVLTKQYISIFNDVISSQKMDDLSFYKTSQTSSSETKLD